MQIYAIRSGADVRSLAVADARAIAGDHSRERMRRGLALDREGMVDFLRAVGLVESPINA